MEVWTKFACTGETVGWVITFLRPEITRWQFIGEMVERYSHL